MTKRKRTRPNNDL